MTGGVRRLRDKARYARLAPWLLPFVWFKDNALHAATKGITMFGRHKLASFGVLALLLLALASLGWGDAGALATIGDAQGLAHRKGIGASRWSPVQLDEVLAVGDWLKTSARGANLVAARTESGAQLILGPGACSS